MSNPILFETFEDAEIDKRFKWFSPPRVWSIDPVKCTLIIKADPETDFWQKTHYGFQVDNGHFLYQEVKGDFRLSTKVHSFPSNRYDQAGLMIRISKDTWLKSSVEYIPGSNNKLGAVVTNCGYSDWSTQEIEKDQIPLFFRITRIDSNYYVDCSIDGIVWKQIRMAHLFEEQEKPILVGVYACSPQGAGYEAHFEFIKIEKLTGANSQAYL